MLCTFQVSSRLEESRCDPIIAILSQSWKEVIDLYGKAVEFPSSGRWINVERPLTLEDLKGYVVLFDFWTYCCINCIHVIPDLKWLEEKYNDSPFLVIGVHSAKFENEREERNIRAAVERYEIEHPVLIDNEYYLWDRYVVRAWPSYVLIGPDGKILSKTSGEGKRDYLSNEISKALEDGMRRGILSNERIPVTPNVSKRNSTLSFPGKIAFGDSRTMFISDSNNDRILVTELASPFEAKVTDQIGGQSSGFADGTFEEARLNRPQGMVYSDGVLFIADTENHAIRKADLRERKLRTISGDGFQGFSWQYSGEASKARLNSPWDLQSDGRYLYIAMAGMHQIWRLDLKENSIRSFAGSGAENIEDGSLKDANFAQPSGIYLDGKSLYVADSEVSGIRYVDLEAEKVHTVAGSGLFSFGHIDGILQRALFQHPLGIHGNDRFLYVADTYNHAIRKIDLGIRRVETIIKNLGEGTCTLDGEKCSTLGLFEPNDVKYYNGLLYIADTNNHLIRVFDGKELVELVIG